MVNEIFDGDEHDAVDDNIEILLEDSLEDPNQSYLYVRIFARPDVEPLLVTYGAENPMGFTPNTNRVSILSNGTLQQLACIILELFEQDPIFIEAFTIAVNAVDEQRNQQN